MEKKKKRDKEEEEERNCKFREGASKRIGIGIFKKYLRRLLLHNIIIIIIILYPTKTEQQS